MKLGVCPTAWGSLILICTVLMVAACTQQPPEPYPNITPNPSPSAIPTHSPNTSDAYDFPIKPGTDAWRAFNSHQEMLDACQIPESILQNMSTHGLVETVMNYPLLSDILAYDNQQLGFNSVSAQFNGLAELLKRSDAGSVLLNKYAAMDAAAMPDNWTDLQKGEYAANFFYIEIILAQESILSTMTSGELQTLLEQANVTLQAKQNLYEIYGPNFLSSTTCLIENITPYLDDSQSK